MISAAELLRRLLTHGRRNVPVGKFDVTTGRWTDIQAAGGVDRDELTLTTFNIWFDGYHAEPRYLAIAELLSNRAPDVMVFQEVTPAALTVSSPSRGSGSTVCARPSAASVSATMAC